MMLPEPRSFAQKWAGAWNARDVEQVLRHFRDDAIFSSPVAKAMGHSDAGVVAGKAAIRRYWTAALALNPHLHFTVTQVYAGADTIVIAYTNQGGALRTEVLVFDRGQVVAGYAASAPEDQ